MSQPQRRGGSKAAAPIAASIVANDETASTGVTTVAVQPQGVGSLSLDGVEKSSKNAEVGVSLDERYENERQNLKVKHWKESPFAVGLTEITWDDEHNRLKGIAESRRELNHVQGCLAFSSTVCPALGAGRVGNMIVFKQSMEWVEDIQEDEESGERKKVRVHRPKLDIVMGPFWPLLCGLTYPLIFLVSGWTFYRAILPGNMILVSIIWFILTMGLIVALAMTACRDPGILYRHSKPRDPSWRWSDQALTYRPRGAIYDPDTASVVEGFDHTCPWTGTAIGKKNMFSFQMFVCLVFVCMIFDIMLLTSAFSVSGQVK